MKYLRRQNLNQSNFLDDTVLQTASGNIELNPTQRVTIRGDLEIIGGSAPGPEVTNVMYVTLDGDDDNSGFGEGANQAKRTLKAALAVAQQGTTIYVRSGTYEEDNPLRVPPKVSIIGDNLRNTIIRPLNGPVTFDITNIERVNNITTITLSAPHGLSTDDRIRVRCSNTAVDETDVNIFDVPAPDQIVYRQAGANITSIAATGVIKYAPDLFLVNSANFLNNMVFKGLQAPAYCTVIDSDAIVDTSPYVQNCSNINGPWLKNGTEWIPFQTEQPDITGTMVVGPRPLRDDEIDPTQVDDYAVDIEGAGGGMLIDGDRYNSQSPIKSMVADAFTQVAQGAIGFHITNFGYMQLVSCFAVFCSKAFYTTRGGYLSISNSVIDFGTEGFVADGYYLDPYNTGVTNQDYYSTVGAVTVVTTGSGFSAPPNILIDPPTTPGGVQATAVASIDPILGIINAVTVTDPGSGYDFQPNVTITPSNGATATAVLAKNQFIEVYELANKPQVGSVMLVGDIDPLTGYENGYYVSRIVDESFTFKYDEQKCRRDVGLILNAVLSDAVLGTNHASTYAGLSYLRSYSSKVTSLQKSQTIAGLQEARNQALSYTSNVAMQNAITSGFNTVINIIQVGLSAAPTVVNNPTTPRRPGYSESASILLANKTFIQDEIEAWISANYPTLSYNVATCRRDISYIIDALAYDLTYEGNTQTVNSALAYAEGSVIAGQVEETQAAYEYWKTIVGQIARNIAITPTVGNTSTQNTSLPLGSPLVPTGPATEAEGLLQIIIDVVDHGTGYVPDPKTEPEYGNGNPTLNIERELVLDNKLAIQDSTIDYLNNSYGGACKVYTFPPIQDLVSGSDIRFHNVSTISTGGTAMEYVGAGVTYNALPFFGGEPDPTKERISINNGKTFTVTSDQVGNYRIGDFFTVNALTGEVSIDAENINLSGISAIGPFRRNGVPVGVQLREVSNNANLVASTGFADVNTVPTQQAVTSYVENRYLNRVSPNDATVAGANITFTGDVAVNGGDLYSTATTFNLLNRDDKNSITENGPTTVNAFLNAAAVNIGHTTSTTSINGNLEVKGSIVSTTQTSVNLLNTTTTTVNAFGDATAINMGESTGTFTVNNTTFALPNATLVNIGGNNLTIQNSSLGSTLTLFDTFITTLNAFRSATTINMGEATGTFTIGSLNTVLNGDLQVKGGDITTNQTTFNLLNTTATTVNAFGAATTLNLAGGSGTTTVGNNLQVNLNSTLGVDTTSANVYWGNFTANIRDNTNNTLNITEGSNSYFKMTTVNGSELTSFGALPKVEFLNTTDATSTTVASTAFAGGVGVAKKLFVGTDLNVAGNAALGNDRTVDVHTIDGTLAVNVPDNTAIAFQIKENTQTYITAVTTNGSESVTIESTPKLLVKNTTDSSTSTTGAVIVDGGVGIAKNLNVGVDLGVGRDVTITGDLSVNGGDITTTAATFNLLNTNATTINFGGASTSMIVGAATGTTRVRNNLDVDGDVNIDGGDLTVSTTTFNLANATATTLNIGGAGTTFNLGTAAGAATTVNIGSSSNSGNTLEINSTAAGTINLTTDVTSGTVNEWQSVTGTINIGSTGTINLGTGAGAVTTVDVGGAITGNTLKISSTAVGTANLTSDVTSGTVNVFADTTGTVNIGGQGVTANIGNTNSNSILEIRGASGAGTATVRTNSGVATADVFNTVVTTGNLFGAATAVNIGAATGTTTVKNNLDVDGDVNIDGGDLTVSTTTFNLANATATTVNAFGAGTSINIGAATGNTTVNNNLIVVGDAEIRGGDLTVNAATTTFNLVNTNATTVNAFGAGTAINIGAATGLTRVRNNFEVDGDVTIDGGDLIVSTATFNIANTTATTVNAFGAATTIEIGAATGTTNINNNLDVDGDVNIDGGDLTVSTATFNIANTTATTVNAFGAATSLVLSAATGTTNIRNNLDVDGDINVDGGDITTSAGTFNLANTTATTVNAFGAATAINIGFASPTGLTTIKHDLKVDGDFAVDGTLTLGNDVAIAGDLAVNGGDLTTTATTFNLINANATTVNFAGAGTALTIGSTTGTTTIRNANTVVTGDLAVNGGDITSSAVTFNVLPTTSTTVNAFGAATALNLGAATGTTIVRNNFEVDLNTVLNGTLTVDLNATVTGDLAVNGGDITTSATTFNLVNTNATTVNFAGAGTAIAIGAATGLTNIKNNLEVDGDVTIDGGDLIVSTATFNLANTTATTLNIGGAGTAVNIGAATGTTNVKNNLDVDGDVNIDGGDLTVSTATFNLANTNATTVNFAGAGTAISIGAATGTTTINNANTVVTGDLAVNGADITTTSVGTATLFNTNATTLNVGGAATAITIGAITGTTTIRNANTVVTGDLAVNGADITTTATGTATVFDTNATTVNAFGAATAVTIGAAGSAGTLTIRNDNVSLTGDLAVNGGDITTNQTTFNLLNTTVTTGNLFGAGTVISIGAATGTTTINNANTVVTGDLAVNGGDITSSATTFNLLNTTVTTGNLFGAGTAITIGAVTGTTTIRNANTVVTGDLAVNGADITTTATGTATVFNTNATTVNAFGAGTTISIGAATGTTTINNANTVVTGDLAVNGGDITTNQTSFNVINGTATTVQAFGAAETLVFASSTGTTTFRSDVVINNDLQVKGGDLTTNAATFNLLNADASTINFGGAASSIVVGAVGGTTSFKGLVDVDGDVNIDGGDLTASTSAFNLLNTTVTTGNVLGVATTVNLAANAASASTLTFGPLATGNTVKIAGIAAGTVNLTTDVTSGTANILTSVTGTTNLASSGTINLGNNNSATTLVDIGGAITGNQLKISGTAAGTVTVTSDVTTGSVNLFNNITTGTLNIAGAGTSTINVGSTTSTVNIGVLALTTDLAVQYGGTGQSSFTTNGVIYGQNASGLAVTAASVPGSNATTSYGILTTDVSNVPVWTDTIDGGSY